VLSVLVKNVLMLTVLQFNTKTPLMINTKTFLKNILKQTPILFTYSPGPLLTYMISLRLLHSQTTKLLNVFPSKSLLVTPIRLLDTTNGTYSSTPTETKYKSSILMSTSKKPKDVKPVKNVSLLPI
jgi:hypothetical protein